MGSYAFRKKRVVHNTEDHATGVASTVKGNLPSISKMEAQLISTDILNLTIISGY